jgi:hypothetical protein
MPIRSKIFVSYSHRDRKLFEEFQTMMAPAIQQDLVDLWNDQKIQPGAQWKDEIQKALDSARIAVLLVSQNFLASRFIVEHELAPLLKAARQEGVGVFWIYLSSCLFEQTEIASYQAAHDVSKPLDRLTKSQRQAVLSAVCAKLILAATSAAPAEPLRTASAQDAAPASVQADKRMECVVLLTEALEIAGSAAQGGGPTTAMHRRLDLAQKWLKLGGKLLPECRAGLSSWLAGQLDDLADRVLPPLIAEARLALPPAGDTDKKADDNEYFRDARNAAQNLLWRINQQLGGNAEFTAVRNGEQKWGILGFRDDQDFEDYLFPPVARLAQSVDPMQRDLFERLMEGAEFTPRQLAAEGYRKDLVMDTVNALLKEKWANWTDLTSLGADGKGKVNEVGKRLLRRLIDPGAVRSTARS